jgi:hypothetical protein
MVAAYVDNVIAGILEAIRLDIGGVISSSAISADGRWYGSGTGIP